MGGMRHLLLKIHNSVVDEEFCVQVEEDNAFTFAIWKEGTTLGHVLQELATICWYFLHKQLSTMTCRVKDHRSQKGKVWLSFCVLKTEKLKTIFAKLAMAGS